MEIQNAKTVIKTEKSSLLLIKHNYRQLIKKIIEEIDEKLNERPEIIVFGKKCNQNRNVGFFSNNSIGYNYSNKLERSKPLTPNLILLLNNVNMQFNSDFNGILINEYINGSDYIGAHSDDENNLSNIGVVSISYGASRNFRIRNKKTKKILENIDTNDYKMIIMKGDFQKEFTHEIPIQKKIKDKRYSFTFRKHNI